MSAHQDASVSVPERLTETVKARVEPSLAEWLEKHARRTARSEGAVIRLALKQYRTNYYEEKGRQRGGS